MDLFQSCWHRLRHVDGKFGTHDLAQAAGHAVFRTVDKRKVITLGIDGRGHAQNIARAVGPANLAALAPRRNDANFTLWDLDLIMVEGYPPEFHPWFPWKNHPFD